MIYLLKWGNSSTFAQHLREIDKSETRQQAGI